MHAIFPLSLCVCVCADVFPIDVTERPNANSINSKEKGREAFKIDPGLFT